jgi:hypothetical protein
MASLEIVEKAVERRVLKFKLERLPGDILALTAARQAIGRETASVPAPVQELEEKEVPQ